MINLKISGRGGNQFFQYAFVQKYIDDNKLNETINISFEYLEKKKTDNKTFVNVLSDFNIKKINIINKVYYTKKQLLLDYIYKLLLKIVRLNAKINKRALCQKDYDFIRKILQKIMNENGLYYYIPGMNPFYKSKIDNIIFFGSYEDAKVMSLYKKEVMKFYLPNKELNEKAKQILDIANSTESVCVTIRRGDFVSELYKKNFYICNENYFEKGIKKMDKLINKPQYIVFSDDIEWCKKNIKLPANTIYENPGNTILEKIIIMSACKNFIISNSTFSWWVQFLSNNSNKKVIAPTKWNNFEYCDPIYMDDWILM